MSAFLVSPHHLNYLVSAGADWRVTWYDKNTESRLEVWGHESDVFAKLYQANVDSLKARYGDEDDGLTPQERAEYCFQYRHDAKPVAILKACACFDYQACEVDHYDATEAAAIVDAIRHAAIRRLPGYKDGPGWEINEPPQEHVIRLSDLVKKP